MNDPVEIQVNFYDSLTNLVFAEPYAVLSNSEISSMMKRLDCWVSTIATHPNLVDMLGDSITAQIKMVTALRVAVRQSRQAGIFPNVIFPPNEYQATMNFLAETRGKKSVS
ncbi:MAG TPA: hypothetical protein VK206_21035 [Anaerolineales bacterium]|nr:hypothetical protein [Anaerolineales bacterium]